MADTGHPHPTPYDDLNAVLHALVDGVREVLGDRFVGAYLQGSFAVGGFDRDSDVDWIIVTETELSPEHVEALQVLHDRIFKLGSAWAQHLEGSYFPRDVLRDLAGRGTPLWYLDNGSRALVRETHCNTAVVRWVVRERGVVLAGPDPATLVDPVPVDILREEILDVMLDWGRQILADPSRIDNRFYQTFAVLSYCRMLHDLQAGSVGSKRTGAEWAKASLDLDPAWAALIDRSWAGRPVPEVSVRTPADPADLQLTLAFMRFVMRAGERYAAALKAGETPEAPARQNHAPCDVRLRDVLDDDLPIFFEQQLDPDATRMAAFPARAREPFMAHWEKILRDDTIVKRTIVSNGQAAGNIVCFEQDGQVRVGYWLGKAYWGRGVATRALCAFLDLVTARPLYAHVATHNIGSLRVLQHCGFTVAGSHTDHDTDAEAVEEFVLRLGADTAG